MYNISTAQGYEPLLHPLVAALYALDQSISNVKFSDMAIVAMLGYNTSQGGAHSTLIEYYGRATLAG